MVIRLLCFLFYVGLFTTCIDGGKDEKFNFHWTVLPELPAVSGQVKQPGYAGPLAGIISDHLVLAGGANFPDMAPWLGGTKHYYDAVFILNIDDTASGWKISRSRLPVALAYSACISIQDQIISVGGENQHGPVSTVLTIRERNGDFDIQALPEFPEAVSNAGIAAIDTSLYVVGGTGKHGALSGFYRADLSSNSLQWEKLTDLPVAVSHAVVVSQWDDKEKCIYVLGGRNKTGMLTDFFSSVWKYSPTNKSWDTSNPISRDASSPIALAAGTGASIASDGILLFGGDSGELFNKTEDFDNQISAETNEAKIQDLKEAKIEHLSAHPGFSKDILLYNTLSNRCRIVGQLPFLAQVTTIAIPYGNSYYIPNGEIKPGVRTPRTFCLTID